MVPDCISRRPAVEDRPVGGFPNPIYGCEIHRRVDIARCVVCPDFVNPEQLKTPTSLDQPVDLLVNANGHAVNLAGICQGSAGFLLLGGPSAEGLDLELLNRRGVFLICSNNSSAILPPSVRPQVTIESDTPKKFGDWLWLDPGVISLGPVTMWHKPDKARVRRKLGPRQFEDREPLVCQCPGALGFRRNHNFQPAQYLTEPTINNGNDEEHATGYKTKGKGEAAVRTKVGKANNYPHLINTMFCTLRIAYYFGVRRLYLLGCDFRMDSGRPYSFAQGKSPGGCESNNSAYARMQIMFEALLPFFELAGYHVFNCNLDSLCYTFPFVTFPEAIERETSDIPQGPLKEYAEGWYDIGD